MPEAPRHSTCTWRSAATATSTAARPTAACIRVIPIPAVIGRAERALPATLSAHRRGFTARSPSVPKLARATSTTSATRSIPFIRPERRDALFGGQGSVLVESLVGTLCAPFTVALHCELSAHGSVGEHVQQSEDELLIVLDGEGTILVNSAARPVGAGSVVGLALGQRLAISNTADTPLRYLIVKAAHR